MSDFIDYVTKDKYGKPRTTERALLAICKVLASDSDLPTMKESGKERTRLKNARVNYSNLCNNKEYKYLVDMRDAIINGKLSTLISKFKTFMKTNNDLKKLKSEKTTMQGKKEPSKPDTKDGKFSGDIFKKILHNYKVKNTNFMKNIKISKKDSTNITALAEKRKNERINAVLEQLETSVSNLNNISKSNENPFPFICESLNNAVKVKSDNRIQKAIEDVFSAFENTHFNKLDTILNNEYNKNSSIVSIIESINTLTKINLLENIDTEILNCYKKYREISEKLDQLSNLKTRMETDIVKLMDPLKQYIDKIKDYEKLTNPTEIQEIINELQDKIKLINETLNITDSDKIDYPYDSNYTNYVKIRNLLNTLNKKLSYETKFKSEISDFISESKQITTKKISTKKIYKLIKKGLNIYTNGHETNDTKRYLTENIKKIVKKFDVYNYNPEYWIDEFKKLENLENPKGLSYSIFDEPLKTLKTHLEIQDKNEDVRGWINGFINSYERNKSDDKYGEQHILKHLDKISEYFNDNKTIHTNNNNTLDFKTKNVFEVFLAFLTGKLSEIKAENLKNKFKELIELLQDKFKIKLKAGKNNN